MKPTPRNEDASAEMIGVLMLISIFVVVIAIIAVGWFSQPAPQKIPAVNMKFMSEGNNIIKISHNGGDAIPKGQYKVLIDAHDATPYIQNPPLKWDMGDTLEMKYMPWTISPDSYVQVVYLSGGSAGYVLASNGTFIGSAGGLPVSLAAAFTYTVHPNSLTVDFIDQSVGGTPPLVYWWQFGDGPPWIYLQNPSHVYPRSGSFTVTYKVRNSTDWNWVTNEQTITLPDPQPPITDFSWTQTSSNPLSVHFIDQSTGIWPGSLLYEWDFGDGSPYSNLQNPDHTYTQSAPYAYTVTHRVRNDLSWIYNMGTASKPVTLYRLPVAAFTSNVTAGQVPLAVQFTDKSTNYPTTWLWEFGDNTTTTEQNATHLYSSAGSYRVNLTAINGGGSNTLSRSGYITVSSAVITPVANFMGTPTTGTLPLTVKFTDNSTNNPTTWNWSFGDGSIVNASVQNPVHTYASPGTYTVSLNATNSGGSNTFTRMNYIQVTKKSFVDFIINENVFVYGNQLTFAGNTVYGPGATIVILGPLTTSDLNGGTSLFVSTIYIDGTVNLDGGSAGLGSLTNPGDIYINGNTNLWTGVRSIYGDLHVNGNFNLKDAWIHNDVYVNGDLTLGDTPTLDPNSHIYYTGTITYPRNYNHPEILSKCIKVATVPGFTMPGQTIPTAKAADWYTSHGYVSSGALRSNMKIFAESYSSTSSW
ncbi:MAG: PKD domain-containing protein, partial [Methanoregula sp.]|nr:PKD domain-containing protein [Methanoregula sp.]